MTWSMPRPVVQWVGALLGLIAATAFTMGIINAPEHGGRLPGERVPGKAAAAGPATAIDAQEATPLSQERIEGPPPVEKPAAKADETDDDKADAATNATSAPLLNLPPAATNASPPEEASAAPSPEDEPPH